MLGQRTKSQPTGTARRILDHARRAFNERGVGAVAIRDLARELDLSPGNVSYHFPTKEALIVALVEEGHAVNNEVSARPGRLDFLQVDVIVRDIMQRDIDNQWFTRDAAGLILSLPTLRAKHGRMQRAREARCRRIIAGLVDAHLLDANKLDSAVLGLQLLTQIFFWVPMALMTDPDGDLAARLDLHARSALALFLPYTTPAGRRQLAPLVSAVSSPAARRRT
jgi:AcrR family transcriptional regulator